MKTLEKINSDIQEERSRHIDAMKSLTSNEEISKEMKKFKAQIDFYNKAALAIEKFSETYLKSELDGISKRKADFAKCRKIVNTGAKDTPEYKEAVNSYLQYRRAKVSAKDNRHSRFLTYLLVN